ncbi:MAG: metalloregulator ArsR/SmtB family transcription factor [Acidobacteriota bacterium]|nr:metalloregulator ArsR/SmtB family transcription factor [Acidobacteriota bacterium]
MSRKPRRAVKPAGFAHAAPLFAALGDETRLALVLRLGSAGPHSIAQLAAGAAVTRQAITKHLQVLGAAGLVRSARLGRERIWNVEADRLDEARRFLEQMSCQWDEALGRLKGFVEKGNRTDASFCKPRN